MTRYWFRPKKFGYGAVPATWQGWLVAVTYALGLLVASIALVPLGETASPGKIAAWAVIVTAGTAATVYIAWRKTEGGWHWRWTRRNAPRES